MTVCNRFLLAHGCTASDAGHVTIVFNFGLKYDLSSVLKIHKASLLSFDEGILLLSLGVFIKQGNVLSPLLLELLLLACH